MQNMQINIHVAFNQVLCKNVVETAKLQSTKVLSVADLVEGCISLFNIDELK